MRASDVRAGIKTLMDAIAPDAVHGIATQFRLLDQSAEPMTAPPRSYRLKLVRQPMRVDLSTYDPYEAEYALEVHYPWAPLIDDVIASDSERIDVALRGEAFIALYSDAIDLTSTPAGVDEQASLVTSRFSVVSRYRLTSAVLS